MNELKESLFCGHEAQVEVEDEELREFDDELIYRVICTWCVANTGLYSSEL